MPKEHMPSVCKWMGMKTDDVLDKFQGVNGSFTDGINDKRFVYIPGSREDRVLIVAHADTVWDNIKIDVDIVDNVLFSAKRYDGHWTTNKFNYNSYKAGVGIGADDRAGCAIAWNLRNLGHSILITSGEEKGCIATKWIIADKWWEKEINETHRFAVQFDRQGKNDAVFYDIATNDFVKYVKKHTGFKPCQGGFGTDIRYLCKDICGVNLSVGYYNEHSENEQLILNQWYNSLAIAREWLSQTDIPKFEMCYLDRFEIPRQSVTVYQNNINGNNKNTTGFHSPHHYTPAADTISKERKIDTVNNSSYQTSLITCINCRKAVTQDEWHRNQFRCAKCGTEL